MFQREEHIDVAAVQIAQYSGAYKRGALSEH
jgi:hypothetical protein